MRMSADVIAHGGFIERPIPNAGASVLPDHPWAVIHRGDTTLIAPRPGSDHLLRIETGATPAPMRRIALPGSLAAPPAWREDELVVVLANGLVALLDPDSGSMTAEPYLIPFDRDHSAGWLTPTVATADGSSVLVAARRGVVRRLVVDDQPRRRLRAGGEAVDLGVPIVANPVSIGRTLVVVTGDGRARALAAADLTPLGAWPAVLPLRFAPASLGPLAIAADASGSLSVFDGDGKRPWTVPLANPSLAGSPVLARGVVWTLDQDGILSGVEVGSGRPVVSIATEAIPAGGPLSDGATVLVPVGRGAFRPVLMDPDSSSGASTTTTEALP
jgi:hypothetical protein